MHRISPSSLGSQTLHLPLPRTWPEVGVLELDGGRVFGSHGWVMDLEGAVLPELSWYGAPSDRIRVPSPMPAALELDGTCLSLVSDWSCRNYSHFLLDSLGRLAVFFDAGFSIADVDHVYCPTPPSAAAAHVFERFDVPAEKRVWAESMKLVSAKALFVPSLPSAALAYPPWLPQFLRAVMGLTDGSLGERRLYISRRGYGRQAISEDELHALLLGQGFEIYDGTDERSRPEDFDQAAVVIGAHGAGLANLAFCRPGTRVIEIIPTDNAHPFYYSLALAAQLDYGYLVGRSIVEREAGAFGPSPYDFDVDLDELSAALA